MSKLHPEFRPSDIPDKPGCLKIRVFLLLFPRIQTACGSQECQHRMKRQHYDPFLIYKHGHFSSSFRTIPLSFGSTFLAARSRKSWNMSLIPPHMNQTVEMIPMILLMTSEVMK